MYKTLRFNPNLHSSSQHRQQQWESYPHPTNFDFNLDEMDAENRAELCWNHSINALLTSTLVNNWDRELTVLWYLSCYSSTVVYMKCVWYKSRRCIENFSSWHWNHIHSSKPSIMNGVLAGVRLGGAGLRAQDFISSYFPVSTLGCVSGWGRGHRARLTSCLLKDLHENSI